MVLSWLENKFFGNENLIGKNPVFSTLIFCFQNFFIFFFNFFKNISDFPIKIQHAGLLDAIERNRTEHNNIEQSKTQQSSTILYYTILYCTVLYIILCYVKKKKKKKGSRAVSAFQGQILHHHHSSLRHAQELQNLEPIRQYICWGVNFLFGSIVSRRREIR